MKFNEIPKSVIALWEFLASPILELLLLFGVGRAIWGPQPFARWLGELIEHATDLNSPATRNALEFYGITKLLPLLTLVFIVLLLYLVQRCFGMAMNWIPPSITTLTRSVFQYVDADIAGFVWCGLSASSINELEPRIDLLLAKDRAKQNAVIEQTFGWLQKRRDSAYYQRFVVRRDWTFARSGEPAYPSVPVPS